MVFGSNYVILLIFLN